MLPPNFYIVNNEWTYADVFVCSITKFVGDGDSVFFEPLQRLLLSALINVSWYLKSLSSTPSAGLVTLLERCAKLKFILAKETNSIYSKYILEAIANILQYQSQGNSRLVYAILRSRKVFFDIEKLKLPIEEILIQMNLETKPTEEWFNDWKKQLMFPVCLHAIRELAPKVDEFEGTGDEDVFLQIIEDNTLVGALPMPQPIFISKYARNDRIDSIIRRCFWLDVLCTQDYFDVWIVRLRRQEQQ